MQAGPRLSGRQTARFVRTVRVLTALALGAGDPTVQYYAALIALQRGDRGGALEALTRAVEAGYPPQLISAAPDFVSLRGDPRFRRLITPAKSSQV